MSSRFVESGEVDMNDLKKQEETEQEMMGEMVQSQNTLQRKSLSHQLRDNRFKKYKEFKEKMEVTNSSYKLKNRDLEYYTKIQTDKLDTLNAEKEDERKKLDEFNRLKSSKEKRPNDAVDLQNIDDSVMGEIKRKPQSKLTGIVKKRKAFVKQEAVKTEEKESNTLIKAESEAQSDNNQEQKMNVSIKSEGTDLTSKNSDTTQSNAKITPNSLLDTGYSSSSDGDSE